MIFHSCGWHQPPDGLAALTFSASMETLIWFSSSVSLGDEFNWFSNVKKTLRPWNKSSLIMIYYPLYRMLTWFANILLKILTSISMRNTDNFFTFIVFGFYMNKLESVSSSCSHKKFIWLVYFFLKYFDRVQWWSCLGLEFSLWEGFYIYTDIHHFWCFSFLPKDLDFNLCHFPSA